MCEYLRPVVALEWLKACYTVPKVVGTVLMVLFTNKGGQQRALFRRGRSTEGAFSKRAVNRGRFFEEGGQQRPLFRRGRSTEGERDRRRPTESAFTEEGDILES